MTTAKDKDDLSIGFHRYRNRRQRELTYTKYQKGKIPHQKVFKRDFSICRIPRKSYLRLKLQINMNKN